MIVEKRLLPVVEMINHAFRVLKESRGSVTTLDELLGPDASHLLVREHGYAILRHFRICVRKGGAYRLTLPTDSRERFEAARDKLQALVIRRLRLLEVFFWRATSAGYFSQEAQLSRADLEELAISFRFPKPDNDSAPSTIEVYTRILQWLQMCDTRSGKHGGIRLRRQANQAAANQNRSSSPIDESEFQTLSGEHLLYLSLGEFFRGRHDFREHGDWTVRLVNDRNDGQPRKVNSTRVASKDSSGQGRNPDLMGYRIVGKEIGSPALEVLAVEVKKGSIKEFSLASVLQAEACFEYANGVYLAIGETYERLRHRTGIMHHLAAAGIGLLTLRDDVSIHYKDGAPAPLYADDWEVSIPAIYRADDKIRRRMQALLLSKYFSEDELAALRSELSPGGERNSAWS